jgi:hypothetical protein
MIMLDKTGSIRGQWANEIDAAKAYLQAFADKIKVFDDTNHQKPIIFHAGAIAWGTEPVYLNDTNNIDSEASKLKQMNPTNSWNVNELLDILQHAKTSVVPSGGTNYGPPFAMFEKELNERGAGANAGDYVRHRQLNFGIFLTDGLATDYKPRNTQCKGLDYPSSGTYSNPLYYGE